MEHRTPGKEAGRRGPRELGDHMRLWTTTVVRHCLDTRCGVASCRERVRQRLHELGGRLRRVRHRHLKAKPEAQAACRAALAKHLAEGPESWARIVVDEAPVRRPPTLTARWGVVDAVPAVPTGDAPTKGPVYGAVAPLTGRTHGHVSPTLGKGELAPFLQPLLAYDPRKHRLVLHDRGEPHQGAPVAAIVQPAGGRRVRKPQPADAPELNPQARLWKWWRPVVTHQHWCATLREPIDARRNVFRSLAGVKEQVRQ